MKTYKQFISEAFDFNHNISARFPGIYISKRKILGDQTVIVGQYHKESGRFNGTEYIVARYDNTTSNGEIINTSTFEDETKAIQLYNSIINR